jgi:hypothetical protein
MQRNKRCPLYPWDCDRESGHAQMVMSALAPKADMCSAFIHVCFGPIADIGLFLARALRFSR